MVLVLVLGDIFIPTRTHDLPAKFKKLLVPGKIQQIVSTGNICDRETWEYLRGIAPDLRAVKGDFDEGSTLPPSLVVQHGTLRIGVLHGHQIVPVGDAEALSAAARKMDVDILISGGTHRFEAYEYDSRFFINPGSASGAYSSRSPLALSAMASSANARGARTQDAQPNFAPRPTDDSSPAVQAGSAKTEAMSENPVPSFALLDIQGAVVVTYVYQLIDDEVRVEKIEFRKI
ncbi:Vacuolar protein sorting-associated protein 29 [Microbotryomycetes sp. JL201]|nr:Vacuolar protein sorting-associated protein 29 [Microbotryomycetes sp. JL201]